MPNHGHHKDLAEIPGLWCGYTREQLANLVKGAGGADFLGDVVCAVPLHGLFPGSWDGMTHFQRPDGSGFYWDADRSLGGLEEIGDFLDHIVRAPVSGSSLPMRMACAAQPRASVCDFRFPSAATMASHWSTFPELSEENGRACHMIADSCDPHHVWGMLLLGHQRFENSLEITWNQQRAMGEAASDLRAFGHMLRKLVDAEKVTGKTVGDICKENAAWSLDYFGQPHRLEECPWDVALPLCSRVIASTMRGLQLMKGTA
jgi:hypothetical protein